MDIWDEGREPADPTSILFCGEGFLPSSISSALRSNIRKVTRVQGTGPGEEPKLLYWGWSVGCGLETLKPCGHWGREGSSSAPSLSPALPPNRLNKWGLGGPAQLPHFQQRSIHRSRAALSYTIHSTFPLLKLGASLHLG